MKKLQIKTSGLLVLSISLLICSCSKDPDLDYEKVRNTPVSTIYPKAGNSIRLASYNVGSFSKYESGCYTLIACMIKELDADVVGLQELDSCVSRTGGVFQIRCVADLLDYSYLFAAAMRIQSGSYGTGLICRDKILHQYTIALPPGGEPRSVAVAEFGEYVVASTHFDWELQAEMQSAELINQIFTERYGACGKPVFLVGDLNVQPTSPVMKILEERWNVLSTNGYTYSSREPAQCIDYVLQLKNGVTCQVTDTQIPTQFLSGSVTQASDHLPIYVDVDLHPNE